MIRRRRKRKNRNNIGLSFSNIGIDDDVKKDAIGVFLFAVALIGILSFLGLAGNLGDEISGLLRLLFGWGSVLFPIVFLFAGWKIVKSEDIIENKASLFGIATMFFSVISFVHIFYEPGMMFEVAKSGNGGGFLGAVFSWVLVNLIGKWGAFVIVLTLLVISLLLVLNVSFLDLVNKIRFRGTVDEVDLKSKEKREAENGNEEKEIDDIKINIAGQEEKKPGMLASVMGKFFKGKSCNNQPEFSVKPLENGGSEIGGGREEVSSVENSLEKDENKGKFIGEESEESEGNEGRELPEPLLESEKNDDRKVGYEKTNWKIPSLDLLDGLDGKPTSGDIKTNSNIIKRTLADFGIQVEMGEVNVGPTVTQYTLKPAVGIKLNRITSLQNDLALALAARSLRIEAPIPGKSWVGIEVPNQSVAMVRLKNLIDSNSFRNRRSNLSIVLGRDVAGNPVLADLAKMPHLLIAGSTGSGKTVCINTLIVGLLFQNSPNLLKFIMIDPKRVELTSYNDIPHLLTPVITDPDKAINSLKWSISEMEKRYDLLSHLGCRNIESYNAAVKTKYRQRKALSYIVIIIDELADLMATHSREMEAAVVRLAQMARAVGIHLVLSTQRPSVEVITGLIKANITARIAFQVASQIDSRTILDMAGAEKLLGSGDMLYLSGDSNKPKRIQGVFISEEEVRKVADFLKSQKGENNEYDEEITEDRKTSLDFSSNKDETDDELYDDAVEVVKSAGKASASLLQRRLRVGYARAARLLDLMEEREVIGPADGAKPRDVLI
jgi:S-DNA-T family DNA segregation ATPase FtsK/SpoIIIE